MIYKLFQNQNLNILNFHLYRINNFPKIILIFKKNRNLNFSQNIPPIPNSKFYIFLTDTIPSNKNEPFEELDPQRSIRESIRIR